MVLSRPLVACLALVAALALSWLPEPASALGHSIVVWRGVVPDEDPSVRFGVGSARPVSHIWGGVECERCLVCAVPVEVLTTPPSLCLPPSLPCSQPLGDSEAYVDVFIQSTNAKVGSTKTVESNRPTWNKVGFRRGVGGGVH
jgi:hypothetical protein